LVSTRVDRGEGALGPYAESSLAARVLRSGTIVDPLVACVGMQQAHYT